MQVSFFRVRFWGLWGGGVGILAGARGLRLALYIRSRLRESRSILSSQSTQAGLLLHFFPSVSHIAMKMGGKPKSEAMIERDLQPQSKQNSILHRHCI